MRLSYALLLLSLCGVPAFAQSTVPPAAAHHGRRSAAEHFADANTTHDGHLTLEQATAGYKSIAKSFNQIDVAHHGYITMDDIKAWRAAKKAARLAAKHAAADAADGIVRPAQAQQRWIGPRPLQTSTDMVVPTPTEPRRNGVDLPAAPVDGQNPS
ncbi:MAG: hypothetical protein ABSE20_09340 [Acetobacteraceae bacterium]|jgi:hypothetical protein